MNHARATFLPERLEETLSLVDVACALLVVRLVTGDAQWRYLAGPRRLIDLVLPFFAQRSKLKVSSLVTGRTDNENALGT
jgi:hypothetical protein